MKVWELIAALEDAKAGSLVCILVPEKVTKAQVTDGFDADCCEVDNDSGIVTIHAKVPA